MSKAEEQKKIETAAYRESMHIHSGKIISVSQEKLHLPNDEIAVIDRVFHPGAVAVLPVDNQNNIVCIRQWRRAAGIVLLEIPAGVLEIDENPSVAAQRELQEEIGFRARKLTPLGGFYTAPGFCTEYIHLFIAQDLIHDPLWADDTDYIDLAPYSLNELLSLVGRGEVVDSKTLSALCLYQIWLKNQENL